MIKLQDKLNAVPVSSTYPYGDIKDNSGSNDGTPVNRAVYADLHQFFEKMFAESGLTANNLPDNADNGFQLFQSLITVGNKNFAEDIIKGLLGSYTADDLIILWGCVISATIPGSSTITAGAIFYNGIIYKVPAATVVTTGSQTLVFKIDSLVQPSVIVLTNDLSGTGIANFNLATVKYLKGFGFSQNANTPTGNVYSGHDLSSSRYVLNTLFIPLYAKREGKCIVFELKVTLQCAADLNGLSAFSFKINLKPSWQNPLYDLSAAAASIASISAFLGNTSTPTESARCLIEYVDSGANLLVSIYTNRAIATGDFISLQGYYKTPISF